MIDRYTDRLSEYLDGELNARERADVDAHLRSCAACRETLTDLRSVVARAAALPVEDPRTDLWPGILGEIEADAGPAVVPLASRRARAFSFSLPQLAAAAVLLMTVSGGSVWLALRQESGQPTGGRDAFVQEAATDPQARVVSNDAPAASAPGMQATLEELERALAENRRQLDPVTIAVLESNLRIIDAAITEARAALQRDPANPYLSEHLGNTIEKKIEMLRRAASIVRAET